MFETSTQALKESESLEMSAENLKVRGKEDPAKWPLQGSVGLTVFSNLHADVPEFVPGKAYTFHPDDSGISHDAGESSRLQYCTVLKYTSPCCTVVHKLGLWYMAFLYIKY